MRHHAAGAVVGFVGVIRDHDGGRQVRELEYSAHPSAADVIAEVVADVATKSVGVRAVAASHRIGVLQSARPPWSWRSPPTIARPHSVPARNLWTPSRSGCRCGNTNSSPTEATNGWARRRRYPPANGGRTSIVLPECSGCALSCTATPSHRYEHRSNTRASSGVAAAQLVDEVADRDAGSHGQLFGVGTRGGAGGREIPHTDVDQTGCLGSHLSRRSRSSTAAAGRNSGR